MDLLRILVLGLGVLLVTAWAALRVELAASRPQAVGRQALAGLAAPVTVERDAAGVPTLTALDRSDLARATGFVHAQERFFQMDLLRRDAAGELAELVGPLAVDHDRGRRLHRMRAVAERTLALAHAEDVALIEAYAAGVNAGLAALRSKPYEYILLRQTPKPWQPIDSVLVSHAMWFDLTDEDGQRERERARLMAALPPAVVELLMPRASSWDAPLRPGEPQPPVATLPGPEVVDLRAVAPSTARAADRAEDPARERLVGSNNFAVGGALTADGRAILAGDMHLGHRVPNIWFRMRLRAPGLDATGVTLPGIPVLVAGSNGRVAWAFTNSYGDWTDLRRLEVDGDRYRTAEGWAPFERATETIAVAREAPTTLELRATRWGPVIEDAGGAYAIEWLAHRPDATNLELLHAERATSVAELIALAPRLGIPPLNLVVADAAGRVGWTIAGRIPQRLGWRDAVDGLAPRGPEAPGPAGYLEGVADLAVVDPPDHRLWTANGRVASGAALTAIGDGGYDLGARASQIRDGLRARQRFAEADLLAIQLDDRALFLAPWRELLLRTLAAEGAGTPLRAEARRLVEGWSGRAAIDDAGYRIVRGFRLEVRERLVAALEAPLRARDPEFLAFDGAVEGAVWRMVTERPTHLLPAGAADWDGFLLAALDASMPAATPAGLAAATWGQANRARIRHPLSGAPTIASLFDMPATPLPGDHHMPRVQTRAFGASQRMVIAPGHEQDGFFHMPAGQSGHPLAPYFGAGHADWEQGRPTPFLPGPTRWTLTLAPDRRDGGLALADAAAPAASGSLAPRAAAAPDGALIVSWLEPRATGHALRFARLGAGGWDAPRDAASGTDWFVNWADTPGVFQAGERLVAHWLRRNGASAYAYDVTLATSTDGGATWSAPTTPHHDGTATEHGFVSHFLTADGFGLLWLDGRNTTGGGHEGHDGHDGHGGGGGMTLRSARFDGRGAQQDEQLVDDLTCDCCPTDVAATTTGPLMVYRDRTAEEVRDVFVARLGAAGWEAPRPVGADRWRMPGCPVNGPAADATGDRVAVGWFTAAGDRPRVELAWSHDGGASFGTPARVDDGAPVGRVELVMRDDHALVIWLEQAHDGAALLRARRAWPDGTLGAPRTLATTAAARASGFPRAVRAGDGVFLAWTDVAASGAKQVKVARLVE